MKRFLPLFCLCLLVAVMAAADPNEQQALREIGETIDLPQPRVSTAFRGKLVGPLRSDPDAHLTKLDLEIEPELVWSEEIYYWGADYIAPHFSKFNLPEGAYVVVRDPSNGRSWTYYGKGKDLENGEEGFWGLHIYGTTAVVELFSARPVRRGAVEIDRFARGFAADELYSAPKLMQPQSICGSDESGWAKCYTTSEPTIYNKSKAVARLLINGTSACTGWLVGNDGSVMTNEHCINTSSAAANTTFEFMAEGASCTTSCATWGACPGTVAATSSTLTKFNATYDYALVKLPTNPTATYGYLQLRGSGAVLNERIYVPQHPAHWGKKIAVKSGSSTTNAKIDSLSAAACSGGTSDLGYAADTQGGSSGSPVIGYSDHLVVGLHHCGTCPNRAVKIQSVISNLGTSLPPGATPGGGGGGTTTQLLANAGFESGAVSWTQTSGVMTNSTSRTPRSGTWYAWLNGYGTTKTEYLYQQITIPSAATAATLNFYLKIDTAETTTTSAYDKLQVQVRNSAGTVLATLATYSNLNKSTSYSLKSFNLLAYKGQTIRVYFNGTEDASLQTSFVIDDTAVNVTQ